MKSRNRLPRRAAVLAAASAIALVSASSLAGAATPQLASKDGLLVLPNVKIVAVTPAQAEGLAKAPGHRENGLKAYKDKDTGQLRKANPEELLDEAVAAARSNDASTVEVHSSPLGGQVAVLNDSFMSDLVVHKTADGKFEEQCVTGDEAAKRALVSTTKKEATNEK